MMTLGSTGSQPSAALVVFTSCEPESGLLDVEDFRAEDF